MRRQQQTWGLEDEIKSPSRGRLVAGRTGLACARVGAEAKFRVPSFPQNGGGQRSCATRVGGEDALHQEGALDAVQSGRQTPTPSGVSPEHVHTGTPCLTSSLPTSRLLSKWVHQRGP